MRRTAASLLIIALLALAANAFAGEIVRFDFQEHDGEGQYELFRLEVDSTENTLYPSPDKDTDGGWGGPGVIRIEVMRLRRRRAASRAAAPFFCAIFVRRWPIRSIRGTVPATQVLGMKHRAWLIRSLAAYFGAEHPSMPPAPASLTRARRFTCPKTWPLAAQCLDTLAPQGGRHGRKD